MIPTVSALLVFAAQKGGHFHGVTELAGGLSHRPEPLFAHKRAAGTSLKAQMLKLKWSQLLLRRLRFKLT